MFDAKSWGTLMSRSILPKLGAGLATLQINPAHQPPESLAPWHDAMAWAPYLGPGQVRGLGSWSCLYCRPGRCLCSDGVHLNTHLKLVVGPALIAILLNFLHAVNVRFIQAKLLDECIMCGMQAAGLLDAAFWPQWHGVLGHWLANGPDMDQLVAWFSGWKALLSQASGGTFQTSRGCLCSPSVACQYGTGQVRLRRIDGDVIAWLPG